MSYALATDARLRVIHALCEGNSINATARQTGVSKPTVLKVFVQVAEGCARLHNRLVRDFDSALIECDEIWSYVGVKQARLRPDHPAGWGEAYTFVGIDINTRFVLSYHVGRRDAESTAIFVKDLRARVNRLPQVNTDGFAPYVGAFLAEFGASLDYAMVHKNYGSKGRRDDHRYEPPRNAFITRMTITGAPDMARCSTSHVEAQNLTMRMHIRRLTRLCNAYSKKRENHYAAMAMHFFYHNFVKVHDTLKTTPAVVAKLAEKPLTMSEMIEMALAEEPSAPPVPVPLALPEMHQGAARELPGGRGWLRVVKSEDRVRVPGAAPSPSAPSVQGAPIKLAEVPPPSQGDLFEWAASRPTKPLPPKGQLNLFPDGDGR